MKMTNVIYLNEKSQDPDEVVKFFRAIIRRNSLRVERRKKDRRKAFFSFILGDRRTQGDRRQITN